MIILGIESSCDETAAAIVKDGRELLADVVATQIDIHAQYGGVVPEIAARSHIEAITPVIQQALDQAQLTWDDIDAIAVTHGPGLSGSLLIGTLAARTLAIVKNKPLYPVNHVIGHVYANFLMDPQPVFPMLALIVSGGHSQIALFKGHLDYELLGQTQDDAVGEAYDKVAKIIGLPYPGGPSVEASAKNGDSSAFNFPKARMPGKYDFSFSGLKTAVLRQVQKLVGVDHSYPSFKLAELMTEKQVKDVAASFNKIAAETLVGKTMLAYEEFQPKSVVIAGGVAANQELRRQLSAALPINITYAPINLCTDNAAMIATLGYYSAQANDPADPYRVDVHPSLSM